ncbi:MAG: YceI family protein [Bacteroidia bacterium]|nr:YceI family protein [Bacteroidia bacterium]
MKNSFFILMLFAALFFTACSGGSSSAEAETADTLAVEMTEAPEGMWDGDIYKADFSEPVAAATAPAGAKTYSVDTEASMMKWKGAKATYFHEGTINISGGSLSVAGGQLVAGSFDIDMNSIVDEDLTDPKKNADLTGHLKSDDFFNAGAYPTSKLVITRVAPGEGGMHMVSGNLTIRDKTHQITFPAELSVSDESVDGFARFSIDRSKFDVKFNSGVFFLDLAADQIISDDLTFYIELKATPAGM